MQMINKRLTGSAYEKLAGEYLEKSGLEILEYNFRCRVGEIDIIAKEKTIESGKETLTIVFVEVKYRKNSKNGHPAEAVSYYKQKKISSVANYYRAYRQNKIYNNVNYRFDVIAILGDEITWYKNAYAYIG